MAGNKNLFQWFCAMSNQEDRLLSLVRGQHHYRKKSSPNPEKNCQRTTLVNLISSVFSAGDDPGWQHGFTS